MAFNFSPKIVTDGLVFVLDAANPKSYISGSTVWTDLSKNNYTGSLVNGPTFSTDNNGVLIFDGSNDYINFGTGIKSIIQGQTNFTIGLMFQLNVNDVLRGLFGTLRYGCGGNLGLVSSNGNLVFYNDYGGNWPDPSGVCSAVGFSNYVTGSVWIYTAATYDGTTTTVYGIKDNVLSKTSGTAKSGSTNVFDYPLEIMKGSNYYSNGKVANAFIYNRPLTQTEIIQNYNATKGRFRLT